MQRHFLGDQGDGRAASAFAEETGTGYATDYSANGAAIAIADTDVSITDPDNTTMTSAAAVLTNAHGGDILSINGPLPRAGADNGALLRPIGTGSFVTIRPVAGGATFL